MNREDVHVFIKAMNGVNTVIEDQDQWSNTTCPYARWLHEKGTDNSPSFGISINEAGGSGFHCFTCSSAGSMGHLVEKLERLSGKSYPVLEEYAEAEEFGGLTPEWGEEDYEESIVTINNDMIYLYDLVGKHPYLTKRYIDGKTSHAMGLRIDPADETRDSRERILFPVYTSQYGEIKLAGFTGRATDNEKVLKVKDYHGLKKKESLLGLEHIKSTHESILIVEGLFDYATMFSYGIPSVAVMGSRMSNYQAEILTELGKPVYLFYDNDDAGHKAVNQTVNILQGYLPVYIPDYPPETEGLDPSELTKYEVLQMIEEARLV